MKSLLSIKTVKPPPTVLTLAKSVFMTGQVSVRELMRLLELAAKPRPFYLIAHRCNDLAKVQEVVDAGANAIECDIQFADPDSSIEFAVDHDYAVNGEPIKPYLDGLVKILQANPQVALVYFDIKDDDADRAVRLREIIRTHLTDIVPVNVIMSESEFASRNFFLPIKTGLRPREAYAIDSDDDPSKVSDFFLANNITRFCYGDGIAAPGVPEDIPVAIMEAVALKWSKRKIRFVYVWTLAAQSSMRDYIATGVDGIMVNDVPALKAVLKESAVKKRVRLATRADNPFDLPVHPSYRLTVKTSNETHAGTDANLTFELRGSAGKLATTLDSYPVGLFEQGVTNHVTLIGKDVGVIQELVLSQDGDENAPGWRVDTVKVQKNGSPKVLTFRFNQEILEDQPVKRTPE